ncbi:hypothetical protein [Parasphingorhabdus cellanae]|uniref:Uncharacterized protein n=1 Tax=Parasphingorhabdus cellanae TaxID=2806553 RepID=A0ABX7T9D1_9SPHN|nr:hypothetical protein [Parasphingorhabdus cellanae]QTD57182.1 hypothetical protein J4G78_06460 [Parasphingorhabdus cellanae]
MIRRFLFNPPFTVTLMAVAVLLTMAFERKSEIDVQARLLGVLPNPETCLSTDTTDILFLNRLRNPEVSDEHRGASAYLIKDFEIRTGLLSGKKTVIDRENSDHCMAIADLDSEIALTVVFNDDTVSTDLIDVSVIKKRCAVGSELKMSFGVPLFVGSKANEVYLHKLLNLKNNTIRNVYEMEEVQYSSDLSPRCFIPVLNRE